MVEVSLEAAIILCYTAFALFLSLYFVPFRIVPKAWAKAVRTVGHPAQVALDGVLDAAVAKIKFPEPDLSKLQVQVDLKEAFKSPEFQSAMDTAFRSAWAKRLGTATVNDEGGLTPEQQQELQQVSANPEGKAQLVAAEQLLDAVVGQKWLKAGTAKAIKVQLKLAFESGRPLEEILTPYQNLFARLGGGAPGVTLVGGGKSSGGPAQF